MDYQIPDFARLMDGKHVLLAGFKGQLCEQIMSTFREHGATIHCIYSEKMGNGITDEIDFTNEKEIHTAVNNTLAESGYVDSLIFCMEPVRYIPDEEMPLEAAAELTKRNLLAVRTFVRAVLPSMKERCMGTIVGITSDYAVSSVPGVAVYSANAAGIQSYLRSIGMEYAKYGIRCNCVMPGFNIGDNGEAYKTRFGADKAEDSFVRFQPIERRGSCIDVANAVLFCASSMSTFMQGENIPVDGGTLIVGHSQVWNPKNGPAYTHMYKKEGH